VCNCIGCIIPRSVIFTCQSFRILGPDQEYFQNGRFWEKIVKVMWCFWNYSSSNLSVLVSTVTTVMPCLVQVRNVGGATGVKGRHQWVVHWLQGWGSSEDGNECEPEPEPSCIQPLTAFETVSMYFCKWTRMSQLASYTRVLSHSFICAHQQLWWTEYFELRTGAVCLKRNVSTKQLTVRDFFVDKWFRRRYFKVG
jgi:hypothetical protein